jgi:hypothetical protein
MRATLIIFLLGFLFTDPLGSQEIFLSPEVTYNSDDGFLLMGMVRDTVLLFHENGNEYKVRVYKDDLEFLFTKELSFEKDKIYFNLIQANDEGYTIIYSFEDRFKQKVRVRKCDVRGNILDSLSIFEERDYLDVEQFSYVLSEDEQKVMLFRSTRYDKLEFILFDLQKMEKLWYKKMTFVDFSIPAELKGILLTNDAQLVLAFEKYNFYFRRKKHFQKLYFVDPFSESIDDIEIPFEGNLSESFNFIVDEKNEEIVVAGLFSSKYNSRAYGYYLYKLNKQGLVQKLTFTPFRPQLLLHYSGKQRNPKKYISDLALKDMVMRNDGGVLLVTEMQKEILRESVRRRYVDYQYEDIVLLSVHPEGDLFWDELIRKYQVSYDDNARYSSYFLFKTPSTLRLVFNDEIKSDNTISEYIFNPLGKGKRNSLLSTDLHKLRLVFEDAVQVSSDAFLVPSMYNSRFRIISIRY